MQVIVGGGRRNETLGPHRTLEGGGGRKVPGPTEVRQTADEGPVFRSACLPRDALGRANAVRARAVLCGIHHRQATYRDPW